jgi:hypothetical protein
MAKRLPHSSVVVRGGSSGPRELQVNAELHWKKSGKTEWAISVFAHRYRDATWIAIRARNRVPHPVIRETTVGAIKRAGFETVRRGRHGHALILLPNPPPSDVWPTIAALFENERPNPALRYRR